MKKLIVICGVCLSLVLLVAACGTTNQGANNSDDSVQEQTEATYSSEEEILKALDGLFVELTYDQKTVDELTSIVDSHKLFADYYFTGMWNDYWKVAASDDEANVTSLDDVFNGNYYIVIDAPHRGGGDTGKSIDRLGVIEYHCESKCIVYVPKNVAENNNEYPDSEGYYNKFGSDTYASEDDVYTVCLSCEEALEYVHPQYKNLVEIPTEAPTQEPIGIDENLLSQKMSNGGVSISIPDEWEIKEDSFGAVQTTGLINGEVLRISISPLTNGSYNAERLGVSVENVEVDGYVVGKATSDLQKMAYINFEDGYIFINVICSDETLFLTAEQILDTIHIDR